MKKPCSEMFCLRNQDITDAKAFSWTILPNYFVSWMISAKSLMNL